MYELGVLRCIVFITDERLILQIYIAIMKANNFQIGARL